MHSLIKLVLAFVAALSSYAVYVTAVFIYRNITSPLQRLKGPRDGGFVLGHIMSVREIDSQTNKTMNGEWTKEHGPVFTYAALLGARRLFTLDPKALNHILMNSYRYQKPGFARKFLSRALGEGVLMSEEDTHKNQRKVMNPAFGPAQIRELFPIFMEKAIKLRELWSQKLLQDGGNWRIDVLSGAGKVTLDIIGVAGFNYELNALDETKKNDLTDAFATLLGGETPGTLPLLLALATVIPKSWPTPTPRGVQAWRAKKMMNRIGKELLERSKQQAREEKAALNVNSLSRPRDLLSLLVRANMDPDVPESQRLSDEEVIAQIPTFLLAGHETTSTATAFCLFSLAEHPELQNKLRNELLAVPTDDPTMDELNALSYLDRVLRETLRLHSPVPATQRSVMQDDVIPVSKPYIDKYGEAHDFVRVRKGDSVLIPILAINTTKEIWGDDALEFKPDRWLNVPQAATEIPGLLNTLTFLGGPRACIGYRFSMVETKVILFTLLRAFQFDLAFSPSDIKRNMAIIVQRPSLKSDSQGNRPQLPLLVRPCAQEFI